ncbi:hypothetical protein ABH940_000845 [Streptacidiphilus sp. BW17]|uniref:hypothetical protein n=1 Tax=Streptacidiphilus sp. BW17 TaxID=3156274 RepID=UPI0035119699
MGPKRMMRMMEECSETVQQVSLLAYQLRMAEVSGILSDWLDEYGTRGGAMLIYELAEFAAAGCLQGGLRLTDDVLTLPSASDVARAAAKGSGLPESEIREDIARTERAYRDAGAVITAMIDEKTDGLRLPGWMVDDLPGAFEALCTFTIYAGHVLRALKSQGNF